MTANATFPDPQPFALHQHSQPNSPTMCSHKF